MIDDTTIQTPDRQRNRANLANYMRRKADMIEFGFIDHNPREESFSEIGLHTELKSKGFFQKVVDYVQSKRVK